MRFQLLLCAGALASTAFAYPSGKAHKGHKGHKAHSSSTTTSSYSASAYPSHLPSSKPVANPPPAKPASNSTTGNRLSVYWGAEDDSTTLDDVCGDDSYQIVNLAFVSYFRGDGGYPTLALSTLSGPSQAQQNAGATSLQDGSSLVSAIQKCQSAGKLVLMSLGGDVQDADITLSGDAEATQMADLLWSLFGGGTNETVTPLRPFGDLKLDGFDIDNESSNPTGYSTFVSRMRSNFGQDTSKTYYLSGAPQCPYPDLSIPLDVCSQLDYVWVQFYNNDDCNVAQSDFISSVKNWSGGIGDAKLFIGALASSSDGQGSVDKSTIVSSLKEVEALNLPNFGGAMLWEAQIAVQNGNYQQTVAGAL